MSFRVEWVPAALNDLATMWIQADGATRQAITTATHAIDQRLLSNPAGEGESRPNGKRITFEGPLGVRFRIEADGMTVSVLQVNIFYQRKK